MPDRLLEHLSNHFNKTAEDFGVGSSKLTEMEEKVKIAKKIDLKEGQREKKYKK